MPKTPEVKEKERERERGLFRSAGKLTPMLHYTIKLLKPSVRIVRKFSLYEVSDNKLHC